MSDRKYTGEPVVHITMGNAVRLESGGGLWAVECLCGWRRDGKFARSTEMARLTAERLAEAYGQEHQIDVVIAAKHYNHPSNPDWQPPSNDTQWFADDIKSTIDRPEDGA